MRTTTLLFMLMICFASRSWGQTCPSPCYIPVGDPNTQYVQQVVDPNPAGTVYVLRAGTHRLQTIAPKDGDQFYGESGAILSGAKELNGWTPTTCGASPCWVVGGQQQQGTLTAGSQTFDGSTNTWTLYPGNLAQFTIAMFYTPSSRPGGGTIDVLGTWGEGVQEEPWIYFMPMLYVNPVGQAVGVTWEGAFIGAASTTTLEIGRRYHLALTCDSDALHLYVDGVLEASNGDSTCPQMGYADPIFRLGAKVAFGETERVHGELSLVAIWDHALSATQIGAIAAGAAPRSVDPATAAYEDLTNCQIDAPRCNYPEDLWFDNVLKHHAPRREQVGPGAWHFDYADDAIYVGDDPSGHIVETSVTPYAFGSSGANVTISSLPGATLRIEKYAVPTQLGGAVNLGSFWRLEFAEIAHNHYAGVYGEHNSTSEFNNVHHNGAFGFVGSGNNIHVISNEIAENGTSGYNPFWGAGGSKWVWTNFLEVRSNWSHNNKGPGLWTDIENSGCVYAGNTIEDNDRQGIFHEISHSCLIENNVIRRNGNAYCTVFPGWIEGAGIQVDESHDVEIRFNTLENNCHGIGAVMANRCPGLSPEDFEALCPKVQNLYVHDNQVTMADDPSLQLPDGSPLPRWNGLIQTLGDPTYFSGRGNRWENNHYIFHAVTRPFFTWNDQFNLNFDQWSDENGPHRQDVNGSVQSF